MAAPPPPPASPLNTLTPIVPRNPRIPRRGPSQHKGEPENHAQALEASPSRALTRPTKPTARLGHTIHPHPAPVAALAVAVGASQRQTVAVGPSRPTGPLGPSTNSNDSTPCLCPTTAPLVRQNSDTLPPKMAQPPQPIQLVPGQHIAPAFRDPTPRAPPAEHPLWKKCESLKKSRTQGFEIGNIGSMTGHGFSTPQILQVANLCLKFTEERKVYYTWSFVNRGIEDAYIGWPLNSAVRRPCIAV